MNGVPGRPDSPLRNNPNSGNSFFNGRPDFRSASLMEYGANPEQRYEAGTLREENSSQPRLSLHGGCSQQQEASRQTRHSLTEIPSGYLRPRLFLAPMSSLPGRKNSFFKERLLGTKAARQPIPRREKSEAAEGKRVARNDYLGVSDQSGRPGT